MIKKYRKEPIIIEAVQWDGSNLKEVIDFIGLEKTWDAYEDIVITNGLKVFTLDGLVTTSIGDYIIKGIRGEIYSCRSDIFEKTYEPVDGGNE